MRKKMLTISLAFIIALQMSATAFAANGVSNTELSAKEFFSRDQAFNFEESVSEITANERTTPFTIDSDEPTWYFGDDAYTLHGGNETKLLSRVCLQVKPKLFILIQKIWIRFT